MMYVKIYLSNWLKENCNVLYEMMFSNEASEKSTSRFCILSTLSNTPHVWQYVKDRKIATVNNVIYFEAWNLWLLTVIGDKQCTCLMYCFVE